MLGDRRQARMCPTYVEGLIGPGDCKSVQPMAMRSPGIGYGADPDMHALPLKTRLDFGQRGITILIEHRNDQIGMGAGLRGTLIATGLASNGAAMFARHLPPTDRCGDPNPKTSGRGSATHPGFRRRNKPIP